MTITNPIIKFNLLLVIFCQADISSFEGDKGVLNNEI